MKKIQQTLGTYDISDMPIINMYLYNRSNNVLIDRDASYRNSEEYYKTKCVSTEIRTDQVIDELHNGKYHDNTKPIQIAQWFNNSAEHYHFHFDNIHNKYKFQLSQWQA